MEATSGEAPDFTTRGDDLYRYARWGLWALPVWALLLAVSTLSHQPSYSTDFPAYARYVTTTQFLISHIGASILGAAIGLLGMVALFVLLAGEGRSRLALWGLIASIVGNILSTSVFGVAAFAQPAIGRAYLSGDTEQAVSINSDVYGIPLFATALPGLLLFATGNVLFGLAVARSGRFPMWTGIGFALGGVLFAIIGFLFGTVQPFGGVVMAVSAAWIAHSAGRRRAANTP
jgi:hypothetical protein